MRTAEDLAIAADGERHAGARRYRQLRDHDRHEAEVPQYEVKEVLKKEVVYLVSFNLDGWAGRRYNHQPPPAPYARGNGMGTDLNRQMPTVGRINEARNPLQESEMKYGHKLMQEVATTAGGRMAYGADVHGELTSNAYVDIMYPAGQFDSVDTARLMAIAERTKSVIDETLYEGIVNEIEEGSGGDAARAPDAATSRPSPLTGRRCGTRSATPTPVSSVTTWRPTWR